MEEKSKIMIYVLKEIFKLPCDKKTMKVSDLVDLILRFSEEIPEKDKEEFLIQVNPNKEVY